MANGAAQGYGPPGVLGFETSSAQGLCSQGLCSKTVCTAMVCYFVTFMSSFGVCGACEVGSREVTPIMGAARKLRDTTPGPTNAETGAGATLGWTEGDGGWSGPRRRPGERENTQTRAKWT